MKRPTSIRRLAASLCVLSLGAACKTEKAPPQDSTRPTAVQPGAGTATGAKPSVVLRAIRDFWRLRLSLWLNRSAALGRGEPVLG